MGWSAGDPLFCTRSGRPVAQAMMRRRLPELARAEGIDVAVIKRQLGHRSLMTTIGYLDHLKPESVVRLMARRQA